MKKNVKKIIMSLIIFIYIITFMNSINAFAGSIDTFDEGKEITEVNNAIDGIGNTVITIIRIVAVAIAIVMLLVIAMRYMLSAPGDRADLKKHAVVYVVGAFILFGVSGILNALVDFSTKITL